MSAAVRSTFWSFRALLPNGGELPADEWERRHDALTRLLWVLSGVMLIVTVALGYPVLHTLEHVAPLTIAALISAGTRNLRKTRSLACSFGLLTVAALGVHLSGG